MAVGALSVALLTVLIGALLLADVSGPEMATPPRRILTGHVLIALATLVVLIAGAAVASTAIGWVGVVALLGTGGLGITALRHTLAAPPGVKRPGMGVLVVHGAAALATVLLAIGAAATGKG